MPTLQDVRDIVVRTTKNRYAPFMGKLVPWRWLETSYGAPFRSLSTSRAQKIPSDDGGERRRALSEKGFPDWHRKVLGQQNWGESSPDEFLNSMEESRDKYLHLIKSDQYVATALLPGGVLQFVSKAGGMSDRNAFRKFFQPGNMTELNIGLGQLAVVDQEAPTGAVTLVIAMNRNKDATLVHASLKSADLVNQNVYDAVAAFLKNCLLRTPRSVMWNERKAENLVLSVSLWDGFIKFHDESETYGRILSEIDAESFGNHLRLSELLTNIAVERQAKEQVEELVGKFGNVDIVGDEVQLTTLITLLSMERGHKEQQNDAPLRVVPDSIYKFDALRRVLTDLCLLAGWEGLKLPVYVPSPRKIKWKPNPQITLPVEDANALFASHSAARPFWYGQFWNDQEVEFRDETETAGRAAACIKRISSLPYDQVIDATIAFQPQAEPLLRRWREIWDRSFPGWQSLPKWHFDRSEKPVTEHFVHDVDRAFRWAENTSVSVAEGISIFDNWVEDVGDDKRDYRLHVIDDADAVCAMVHLAPDAGFLNAVDVIIQYTGIDSDGYPTFREAGKASQRVNERLNSCPDYWNWPFYKKYLGRRGVVTNDGRHTAAVLADMALQGHSHAFLKGVAQKSGTWTVNLIGITNLEDAQRRLAGTLEREHQDDAMYVQEQVPFTHEQRFYIQGGRLFASACSDRNFSAMNSTGKRLDSRVAVLKRPSIDAGYYDRGQTTHVEDRKTSAMFARQVRKIVAELNEYGLKDYSIDMGLTERGMISVEVNTLHLAGPYSLRREFYTKQFERSRKKANDLLARKACEVIQASGMPHIIREKAVAIIMASDYLVQLSLKFADTPSMERGNEETKIAMVALLLALIGTKNHEIQVLTEAA